MPNLIILLLIGLLSVSYSSTERDSSIVGKRKYIGMEPYILNGNVIQLNVSSLIEIIDGKQFVLYTKTNADYKIIIDSILRPDGTYSVHELNLLAESGRTRYTTGVSRYFWRDSKGKLLKSYSIGLKKDDVYDSKGIIKPCYEKVIDDTVINSLEFEEKRMSLYYKDTLHFIGPFDNVFISSRFLKKEKMIVKEDTIVLNIQEKKQLKNGELFVLYLKNTENHNIIIDSIIYPNGTYSIMEINDITKIHRTLNPIGIENYDLCDEKNLSYTIGLDRNQIYDSDGSLYQGILEVRGDTVFYDCKFNDDKGFVN